MNSFCRELFILIKILKVYEDEFSQVNHLKLAGLIKI